MRNRNALIMRTMDQLSSPEEDDGRGQSPLPVPPHERIGSSPGFIPQFCRL
jgi:hypothetical protein